MIAIQFVSFYSQSCVDIVPMMNLFRRSGQLNSDNIIVSDGYAPVIELLTLSYDDNIPSSSGIVPMIKLIQRESMQ